MCIYVLSWIKEDLKSKGDDIGNYTLLEIKGMLHHYNNKFCK